MIITDYDDNNDDGGGGDDDDDDNDWLHLIGGLTE